MKVYYNEFDPKAGEWLKILIEKKLIPDGVVDTRSIKDVRADDLQGFTQCHFFAGIGGWNYALELAGIDPSEPLWTGSCPCQPYSQAGKGEGFEDERDLWPVWFNLIKECKPAKVFGEQVKRAIKHGWLDRVYADMESENYACGSIVLGAHSVDAPHQRQRLYFGCVSVSDSNMLRHLHGESKKQSTESRLNAFSNSTPACSDNSLAENTTGRGCRGRNNGSKIRNNRKIQTPGLCTRGDISVVNGIKQGLERYAGNGDDGKESERLKTKQARSITKTNTNDRLADIINIEHTPDRQRNEKKNSLPEIDRQAILPGKLRRASDISNLSPWNDFALVLCKDTDKNGNHKVRRVPAESVLFGMADGIPESMDFGRADRAFPLCQGSSFEKGQIAMLLKGYGNAIVPQDAALFIKSFMDTIGE